MPLAEIGVGPGHAQRRQSREGALPASAQALTRLAAGARLLPPLHHRSDLGWFDDFGHSGFADANGGIGRISTTFNAFTLGGAAGGTPIPIATSPLSCAQASSGHLDVENLRRCPGANAARSRRRLDAQFTDGGALDCDPESRSRPGPP